MTGRTGRGIFGIIQRGGSTPSKSRQTPDTACSSLCISVWRMSPTAIHGDVGEDEGELIEEWPREQIAWRSTGLTSSSRGEGGLPWDVEARRRTTPTHETACLFPQG